MLIIFGKKKWFLKYSFFTPMLPGLDSGHAVVMAVVSSNRDFFFMHYDLKNGCKVNLRIIPKNHCADPEISFLTKSVSKPYCRVTVMPIAWELITYESSHFRFFPLPTQFLTLPIIELLFPFLRILRFDLLVWRFFHRFLSRLSNEIVFVFAFIFICRGT